MLLCSLWARAQAPPFQRSIEPSPFHLVCPARRPVSRALCHSTGINASTASPPSAGILHLLPTHAIWSSRASSRPRVQAAVDRRARPARRAHASRPNLSCSIQPLLERPRRHELARLPPPSPPRCDITDEELVCAPSLRRAPFSALQTRRAAISGFPVAMIRKRSPEAMGLRARPSDRARDGQAPGGF